MKIKNKFLAAIVLLVAVIVSVAVVSCKKEKQDPSLNNGEQTVQAADNMDEYLIAFKKKLLSAEKDGETITLEQAECDLGNLLNFDFGDANYATNVFHYDTIHTQLVLNDGQVDLSQLAVSYLSAKDLLRQAYHQIDLPEKSVYTISCTIDNSSKDETADVEIVLTTRAYEESNEEHTNDWRAGNLAGRCDGYLAGRRGAPEQIVYWLMSNLGVWVCENGGRIYLTEEGQGWKESIEVEMVDLDGPRHHKRLFYEQDLTGTLDLTQTCIPNSEMMYYYNQARNLIDICGSSFHPNPIPSNHVATNYWIDYEENIWNIKKTAWWKIYIWHAKLNCTGTTPEPM